ncbi:MAG TPA: NAD(P)H-hydrate dehydratase [Abditibacteriaceae bacterium]|jgi:NAD(P)H-hydrate epimerase
MSSTTTSKATPQTIDRDSLRTMPLPEYSDEASKADYGKLLIVAGSRRLPGPAILAARAALRCGCGTVRVAAPESIATHIGVAVPELMMIPLPETATGTASRQAYDIIEAQFRSCDAVVLGPGLDEHEETDELARLIATEAPLPLLLDAQALLAIAKNKKLDFGASKAARVLTPHPGELSTLLGRKVDELQSQREKVAVSFARDYDVTLVFKGRETLISAPDGTLLKNQAGTRGMGTAGSGDVLAGAIGGLLTQGMAAPHAAAWGVHLHALAGEAAQKEMGDDGMMARDFLEMLPRVLRYLRGATENKSAKTRTGLRPT